MEMKHYKKQSQVVYNKKNGVEKPWLIRYNFHIYIHEKSVFSENCMLLVMGWTATTI